MNSIKNGQVSFEHIMVVSMGLLIIIPTIYYFYGYSFSQTEELSEAQIYGLANSMINEAEAIYTLGPPSKYSFVINIPPGVEKFGIDNDNPTRNKELIFTLKDQRGTMVFYSEVPLSKSLTLNAAGEEVDCTAECFSQGAKKVTLIATDNNVKIIIK